MNLIRALLFAIISFLISGTIYSQQLTDLDIIKMKIKNDEDASKINFEDKSSYIGTPYVNPDFQYGTVYIKDSLISPLLALRYNVISKQIETKESLKTRNFDIINLKKVPDLIVKIKEQTFVLVPFEGSIQNGEFFEVLYEGTQVDILKKHAKDVRYPLKSHTSLTRDIPAKFTDNPLYFLVTKRKRFFQLPDSKNDKYQVFGQKADFLKKYAKDKKLNIEDETDLITIVKYFEKQ
ncbi:hypothetical protein [Patiriisocius marinistellae]|nr:hypothetical protein [Patiriisocius marinistellae]